MISLSVCPLPIPLWMGGYKMLARFGVESRTRSEVEMRESRWCSPDVRHTPDTAALCPTYCARGCRTHAPWCRALVARPQSTKKCLTSEDTLWVYYVP